MEAILTTQVTDGDDLDQGGGREAGGGEHNSSADTSPLQKGSEAVLQLAMLLAGKGKEAFLTTREISWTLP